MGKMSELFQNLTRACPLEVKVDPTSYYGYIFPMAVVLLLAAAYKVKVLPHSMSNAVHQIGQNLF